jgi:hypothetical protein
VWSYSSSLVAKPDIWKLHGVSVPAAPVIITYNHFSIVSVCSFCSIDSFWILFIYFVIWCRNASCNACSDPYLICSVTSSLCLCRCQSCGPQAGGDLWLQIALLLVENSRLKLGLPHSVNRVSPKCTIFEKISSVASCSFLYRSRALISSAVICIVVCWPPVKLSPYRRLSTMLHSAGDCCGSSLTCDSRWPSAVVDRRSLPGRTSGDVIASMPLRVCGQLRLGSRARPEATVRKPRPLLLTVCAERSNTDMQNETSATVIDRLATPAAAILN